MTFWIIAGLMLLLALGLVLPPLLRRPRSEAPGHEDALIDAHRRRLSELEADQAAGTLSAEAAAEARLEIERQLLVELRPQAVDTGRPGRLVAVLVAVLVPALALGLYFELGSFERSRPQVEIPATREGQVAFIREHLGELETRVARAPEDLEAWLMLGRSYMVLEEYDRAAEALARAQARIGDQPTILADRAEAVGYAAGGDLSGLPSDLLGRALAVEPAHPKALWLAGLAALQQEKPRQAEQYWRRLLSVLPPQSEAAAQVKQTLARIIEDDAEPLAGRAELEVAVRILPELAAGLPADATVFVLARAAEGPRAPLAALRRELDELPLSVRLNDSLAMVEGMNLSAFPEVVVEARVSRSGQAEARSGDLIGRSDAVSVAAGRVEVVIDQIVP